VDPEDENGTDLDVWNRSRILEEGEVEVEETVTYNAALLLWTLLAPLLLFFGTATNLAAIVVLK
jgi:hypothetical protein